MIQIDYAAALFVAFLALSGIFLWVSVALGFTERRPKRPVIKRAYNRVHPYVEVESWRCDNPQCGHYGFVVSLPAGWATAENPVGCIVCGKPLVSVPTAFRWIGDDLKYLRFMVESIDKQMEEKAKP